ncbi:hypothetical protein I3842_05G191200 [Carya illinoinensis]|nr:hypothetical protein I3842_05G191200 [Carya illinoinensis]
MSDGMTKCGRPFECQPDFNKWMKMHDHQRSLDPPFFFLLQNKQLVGDIRCMIRSTFLYELQPCSCC